MPNTRYKLSRAAFIAVYIAWSLCGANPLSDAQIHHGTSAPEQLNNLDNGLNVQEALQTHSSVSAIKSHDNSEYKYVTPGGKTMPYWNYAKHGADWTGGMCKIGHHQSPVDLHADGLVQRPPHDLKAVYQSVLNGQTPQGLYDGWRRGDVVYSYRHFISSLQVLKTKKVFRLTVPKNEGSCFGALFTTDKPNLYMATHIEFHSPSEHTFEGSANRRQIEMQIWHYYGDDLSDSGINALEHYETTELNVIVNGNHSSNGNDEHDHEHAHEHEHDQGQEHPLNHLEDEHLQPNHQEDNEHHNGGEKEKVHPEADVKTQPIVEEPHDISVANKPLEADQHVETVSPSEPLKTPEIHVPEEQNSVNNHDLHQDLDENKKQAGDVDNGDNHDLHQDLEENKKEPGDVDNGDNHDLHQDLEENKKEPGDVDNGDSHDLHQDNDGQKLNYDHDNDNYNDEQVDPEDQAEYERLNLLQLHIRRRVATNNNNNNNKYHHNTCDKDCDGDGDGDGEHSCKGACTRKTKFKSQLDLYHDLLRHENMTLLNQYLLDHLRNAAIDTTAEQLHVSERRHVRSSGGHWGRWAVLSLTFMSEEMAKTKIETLKRFPSEQFMKTVLDAGAQVKLRDDDGNSAGQSNDTDGNASVPIIELDNPLNLPSLLMMLETKNISYFAYDGSFTQPGCEETVRWYVARGALPISTELMLQIHNMLNPTPESDTNNPDALVNNYRELQNVNQKSRNNGKVHLVHAYPMEYFIATSFAQGDSGTTTSGGMHKQQSVYLSVFCCIMLALWSLD